MIAASLDVGSNTVRWLVAEIQEDPVRPGGMTLTRLNEGRRVTRLGQALYETGRLKESAIGRTFDALSEFRSSLSRYPAEAVVCAGTSAVREAANGAELVERIKRETGFELEVISGEEEARRTLLGVEQGLDLSPRTLFVIDIGGGSTELILKREGEPIRTVSTPLGVVKLTERYLPSDPPSSHELRELAGSIEGTLKPALEYLGPMESAVAVGTAGTATTFAAMELGLSRYDPGKVQNRRMTRRQVEVWFERLVRLKTSEREGIAGLEKGREDLIVPGAALLIAVLKRLSIEEWIVSDTGLREGLLVDWWKRRHDGS